MTLRFLEGSILWSIQTRGAPTFAIATHVFMSHFFLMIIGDTNCIILFSICNKGIELPISAHHFFKRREARSFALSTHAAVGDSSALGGDAGALAFRSRRIAAEEYAL